MAVVLDTRALPPHERLEALNSALSNSEVPTVLTYSQVSGQVGHRVELWNLGTGCHLTRIAGTGMHVFRGPKQIRMSAPERVGLSLQSRSPGRFTHQGFEQIVEEDNFTLTDGTSPSTFSWTGIGKADTVVFDYTELGIPIAVARAAAPRLAASPVYGLVRSHVTGMFELGDTLDSAVSRPLKAATVDLVRALIVTAANPGQPRRREALDQIGYHRVVHYLRGHLTDPGLNPESVARALGLSVRQLYRIWSCVDVPLAEWIIQARLEIARRELADTEIDSSMEGLAKRCGFADATHFARRFRQAYGQSPRDWRHSQAQGSASLGPWTWATPDRPTETPSHNDPFIVVPRAGGHMKTPDAVALLDSSACRVSRPSGRAHGRPA